MRGVKAASQAKSLSLYVRCIRCLAHDVYIRFAVAVAAAEI